MTKRDGYGRPAWEPFEVLTQGPDKIRTWKHDSGEYEQWRDSVWIYGPEGSKPEEEPKPKRAKKDDN